MYMAIRPPEIISMQKAQVFLREDQKEQLKAIAARTGAKQSELIRRGVDMVIEVSRKDQADWKAAWKQGCGIWKDRSDIDEVMSGNRARLNARLDRLQT